MSGYHNDFNSSYGNNVASNENWDDTNYETDFSRGLGSQSMVNSQSGLNMGDYGNVPHMNYETANSTGASPSMGGYSNVPYMNYETVYSAGVCPSMAYGEDRGGSSEDNWDEMHENPEYRSAGDFLNHNNSDDDDDRFSLPDDDLEAAIWNEAEMQDLCSIALLEAVRERQKRLKKKKIPFHPTTSREGIHGQFVEQSPRAFLPGEMDIKAMFNLVQRNFTLSTRATQTSLGFWPHTKATSTTKRIFVEAQIVLSAMVFHNCIRHDRDQEKDLFPPVERQREYVFQDLPDSDPTREDREDMPQYGVLNDENDPYMNSTEASIATSTTINSHARSRSRLPLLAATRWPLTLTQISPRDREDRRRPWKRSPPMAYVERGVVKSKRSIWRLKTITDFFWAIVNIIGVFFATMFSMEKSDAYKKGKAGKKWDGGGPGGPGSGPYGGGPRGPPRGLDNVRGIDHSSLPACGSCCG
ncbi:hypothetical protein Vadar_014000 [Vaccinium darrowii]|uniref:Uncharacterized protein n=1 Tax=Vaccinium darrowii TaxID=229202 RepID=A0ACB7X0Z5_9ERIC|nr:hypothetical protein Vadar_014000 [Vaccinium darrowii]